MLSELVTRVTIDDELERPTDGRATLTIVEDNLGKRLNFPNTTNVILVSPWTPSTATRTGAGPPWIITWPLTLHKLEQAIQKATGLDTKNEIDAPAIVPLSNIDKGSHILIAEDNRANQKVIEGMLTRWGFHRCDVVVNGKEALEALSTTHYDLVLMDCNMPIMDGYQATKEIRKMEKSPKHTPILALTANVTEEDKEHCFEVGMDGFLSKPIRPKQLQEALERILHRHSPDTVIPGVSG
jgi:CheY-like chemotaxis protein